nr:hypothetical protein [Tanacetum cinerariifolium]
VRTSFYWHKMKLLGLWDAPPISNLDPPSLIALQAIDCSRPLPYTSHPPMGLLRIASVASLVSDVST